MLRLAEICSVGLIGPSKFQSVFKIMYLTL